MTYITVPIETDPEDLIAAAIEELQAKFPGWEPADGNLDYWLIQSMSSQSAELRDVASAVPDAIFRYFGDTIMGIPPIDAQAATTTSTWTMIDNQGYTIPAGTQVGIRTMGDDLLPFQVLADVVVPPGSTVTATGAVTLVAVLPGADASGIGTAGGPAELIDPLIFVASITIVAVTTGGVDAEADDAYLSRLTDELTLMAPRPILPADFAIMARSVAGVARATAVDGWDPASVAARTGSVTSGSASITGIAGGTVASTMIGAAITGTNIPAGTYIIAVPSSSSLTMSKNATGTNAANALTITGEGGKERMITVAMVDALGNPVSSAIKLAVQQLLDSRREVNFVVNTMDPVYSAIDVTATVKALAGFDTADVDARVTDALQTYLSAANWGGDFFGTGQVSVDTWVNTTTIRYLELAQVINSVLGVDYVVSLTFAITGSTLATTDVVLPGPIALPTAGTMNVTVT